MIKPFPVINDAPDRIDALVDESPGIDPAVAGALRETSEAIRALQAAIAVLSGETGPQGS